MHVQVTNRYRSIKCTRSHIERLSRSVTKTESSMISATQQKAARLEMNGCPANSPHRTQSGGQPSSLSELGRSRDARLRRRKFKQAQPVRNISFKIDRIARDQFRFRVDCDRSYQAIGRRPAPSARRIVEFGGGLGISTLQIHNSGLHHPQNTRSILFEQRPPHILVPGERTGECPGSSAQRSLNRIEDAVLRITQSDQRIRIQ